MQAARCPSLGHIWRATPITIHPGQPPGRAHRLNVKEATSMFEFELRVRLDAEVALRLLALILALLK